jgi:hypothetical protein
MSRRAAYPMAGPALRERKRFVNQVTPGMSYQPHGSFQI